MTIAISCAATSLSAPCAIMKSLNSARLPTPVCRGTKALFLAAWSFAKYPARSSPELKVACDGCKTYSSMSKSNTETASSHAMAYIVMAYVVVTNIVMAYIVMAYMVMAYIVTHYIRP